MHESATRFEYQRIVAACEHDLSVYGDTFRGVGWTKKQEYADLRYRIMLEGIRPHWARPLQLLDFGCGASHLYEYMQSRSYAGIVYSGLDLSSRYLNLSRAKHPGLRYYHVDLLDPSNSLPTFDYVVLNGVFNYKGDATHESMWNYCQSLLLQVARHARLGFAFNVMSKYVDWERDDLFHLPLEAACDFLSTHVSRHFTTRHDYGLYEYTVYAYLTPLSEHA